jgi:hypothetical protein
LFNQVVPRAWVLYTTKIFIIAEDVLKFLTKEYTKNDIGFRHLPFDNIFIPVNVVFNKFRVRGIGLYNYDLMDKVGGKSLAKMVKIIFIAGRVVSEETQLFSADLDDEKLDTINSPSFDSDDRHLVSDVKYLVCNILDFINNPDVELVHVERTKEENVKRMDRGKIPIPVCKYVRINGQLKIYFDELNAGGEFNYSHKFWVRGHFRVLRDEHRWKDKVGTKIWIPPFIKGKGIFIQKEYVVEKK